MLLTGTTATLRRKLSPVPPRKRMTEGRALLSQFRGGRSSSMQCPPNLRPFLSFSWNSLGIPAKKRGACPFVGFSIPRLGCDPERGYHPWVAYGNLTGRWHLCWTTPRIVCRGIEGSGLANRTPAAGAAAGMGCTDWLVQPSKSPSNRTALHEVSWRCWSQGQSHLR